MNAAWRRTVERAAAGDGTAIVALRWLLEREGGAELTEAVWRALLAVPSPDPGLWAAVRADCLAALDDGELLTAAARDDGHPVAQTARERIRLRGGTELEALCLLAPGRPGLAAWCAQHASDLVSPPVAAMLLLVTGQAQQYHAIDPDGGALRAVLAMPGLAERGPLLAAMAAAGVEPALVAGGAGPEALVLGLPVARAAEAARGLAGGPAGAALLELLAAADADRLDRATFALIRLAPPVAVVAWPDGPPRVVDLCELPERPLGELLPFELGVLEEYLTASRPPPDVRELLELLRDCLRLRYGDGIELGGRR
nr:hypothetical protein GCM10020063_053000 [Dactylosporangium thailandense]